MSDLEQARKEKLARNELMMRQLMGAAEDLATTVEADRRAQEDDASKSKKNSRAYKKRLAEEALQVGKRKLSSRAATAAAKKKIANAFAEAVPQEHAAAASDDSAEFEHASEADSEENSDPSVIDSEEECEEVPNVKKQAAPKNGSNKAVATKDDSGNADDGSELQLALAISMQEECEQDQPKKPKKPIQTAKSKTKKAAPSKQVESKEDEVTAAVEHISKPSKKRNRGLDLAQQDTSEIFDFIANGKVTLGVAEFVGVVNRLGLDIDDSTVEAAFECLQQSPFAGPCNRVDKPAFQAFVQYLRDL